MSVLVIPRTGSKFLPLTVFKTVYSDSIRHNLTGICSPVSCTLLTLNISILNVGKTWTRSSLLSWSTQPVQVLGGRGHHSEKLEVSKRSRGWCSLLLLSYVEGGKKNVHVSCKHIFRVGLLIAGKAASSLNTKKCQQAWAKWTQLNRLLSSIIMRDVTLNDPSSCCCRFLYLLAPFEKDTWKLRLFKFVGYKIKAESWLMILHLGQCTSGGVSGRNAN